MVLCYKSHESLDVHCRDCVDPEANIDISIRNEQPPGNVYQSQVWCHRVTQRIRTPFLPKDCVLQVSAAPCDGCSCCCSTTTHAMSFGPLAVDRGAGIRTSPLKWFRILSMESWCVLHWVASRFLTIRHSRGTQAFWETSACLNLWAFCGTEFVLTMRRVAEIWKCGSCWNNAIDAWTTWSAWTWDFHVASWGDCRLRVFPSMERPGSVDKSKERIQASKYLFFIVFLLQVWQRSFVWNKDAATLVWVLHFCGIFYFYIRILYVDISFCMLTFEALFWVPWATTSTPGKTRCVAAPQTCGRCWPIPRRCRPAGCWNLAQAWKFKQKKNSTKKM